MELRYGYFSFMFIIYGIVLVFIIMDKILVFKIEYDLKF